MKSEWSQYAKARAYDTETTYRDEIAAAVAETRDAEARRDHAESLAAQIAREHLELALSAPSLFDTKDAREHQARYLVKAVLAVYFGALED